MLALGPGSGFALDASLKRPHDSAKSLSWPTIASDSSSQGELPWAVGAQEYLHLNGTALRRLGTLWAFWKGALLIPRHFGDDALDIAPRNFFGRLV
jgi:hypothetical protein